MKTGRSLQDLALELKRQRDAKRDFVVNTQWMEYSADARTLSFTSMHAPDTSLGMSRLFHRQVGTSLGIPAKYYGKMQEQLPGLLAHNVNQWFENTPSKHMVRALDGTARAFLSDRYRRIDNYEIAGAVLPIIGEIPDARIESCEITENRMYIKVVNPRLEAEVQKGDFVQGGVVISNSEVGLGSVSVMPLLYRLVCMNGMIVNDFGQRRYHVGRELDESWELYRDETLRAEDNAFMMKLADTVKASVNEVGFDRIVGKLRQATGVKITGHVPEVVELAAKQYGLTTVEETDILQHLIAGGDLSLYGLANAVTRTANDSQDYDRATALESAGWQITAIHPGLWAQINKGEVQA